MKITKQKKDYLLVDFASDTDGFNVIILCLNNSLYETLKKGRVMLEQLQKDEVCRVEFKTTAGRFIKIDLSRESVLKEWFFTHKGRSLFLDGPSEEIKAIIGNQGTDGAEQTLSISNEEGEFHFYISLLDRIHNSTIEYASRDVPFTALGL